MLQLNASVCIDAPVEKVWEVLSRLEAIQLWVRSIRHSYCPERDRGVGALRVCELSGATLHETITAWDEGRSFTYRGEGAPLMKRATNTWSLEPSGGKTLVRSAASVELKGGIFGRLLEPLVAAMSARLGAQSLASLKYLVEQGHPYQGTERLAAQPPSC